MRKSETVKIREIINAILKERGLEGKMAENRLLNAWNELLGKTVANSTQNLYIKDNTLFVHLRSSVIRHQLMMIKPDLIKRLNEKAGIDIIENIVLR
ncbi:MAG: DUF721 domain-containing protein [Bacteroidales bacterium]|nr:DUF721 domain-containing protein [Bacteroidales bacterium]MCF8391671.1 DUF721 domain-containing protein [Bacteroidales bacterium]